MNAPELKVHEDSSGRRVYETGGRCYPSVTTILSEAYPKPHLVGWGSKMAAQAAVEGGHEGMSEREALAYLQRAPYRYMRMRGNQGAAVRDQLEKILAPGRRRHRRMADTGRDGGTVTGRGARRRWRSASVRREKGRTGKERGNGKNAFARQSGARPPPRTIPYFPFKSPDFPALRLGGVPTNAGNRPL